MRNFAEYTDMEVSILVEEMQAGRVDCTLDDLKDAQAEVVNRRLNSRYAGILSDLMREKIINSDAENSDEIQNEPVFVAPVAQEPTEEPAPEPAVQINVAYEPVTPEIPSFTPTPPIIPAIATNNKSTETKIEDMFDKTISENILEFTDTKKKNTPSFEEEKIETDYPVFKFLAGLFAVLPWLSLLAIYGLFAYELLYGYFVGNFNFLVYGGIGSIILSFTVLLTCLGLRENLIWKMNVAKRLENR